MKCAVRGVSLVIVIAALASLLQAQPQIAVLLTPPNGASDVDPTFPIQFTWTSVSGAQAYYLYVGTTLGANDVVNSGETLLTSWSAYVGPSTYYYVRMWTKINGVWYYGDTTFSTGTGIARLTAPSNGATNVDPSLPVLFTWTSVPTEQAYYLYVGTAPGLSNIVNSGETQATSWTATLSPLMQYYVRLWTKLSGVWRYNDSSFSTNTGIARLITPGNGANNIDPTLPVQFSWNSVPTEQAYYLYVGTTPGSNNVVNTGEIQQTTWTANLGSNTTYYARTWTKLNGHWQYSDSSFSTGAGQAHLITPANGATGVNQFAQFTWNTVPIANEYLLLVSPTNFNTWDMFADDLASTVSNRYVWGLLPNTYYYVTLCTETSTGELCSYSTFTTGPAGSLPNRQAFYSIVESLTSQVRLMTQGMTNQAIQGTPLYQEALNHNHNPNQVDCGDYTLTLLDLMDQQQILGRRRDMSLDGTHDGHVVAEYYDPFNSKWQVADSTFGLIYFDPHSEAGQGAEDINALLLAGNLSAIDPLWVTNSGSAYMTNYYMDPITLYTNPYPFGDLEYSQLEYNYVPNSPISFMNASSLNNQGVNDIYIFRFANQADQITINNAGTIVTITPFNTYGWASGLRLWQGWYVTSEVPPGMNMYTFKRILF
ncbi:MAG: hypothetical protein WA655_01075 [Candidatus Korobacteraceae bacterium]